jgi:uncharacterized protein (TIGR00251 family)
VSLDVRDVAGGARLTVHVQPRASRAGVTGLHGVALKVRVDAPPLDGRANERLVEIVADALAVSRRSVRLVAGEGSRDKILEVDGLTAATVTERLGV